LNVLDAVLTYFIMNNGGQEGAPVLRFLVQGDPIRLVVFKALGIILVLVLVASIRRFRWSWALKWTNIGLFVVVIWNLVGLILTL
jgi:hypothetical protein